MTNIWWLVGNGGLSDPSTYIVDDIFDEARINRSLELAASSLVLNGFKVVPRPATCPVDLAPGEHHFVAVDKAIAEAVCEKAETMKWTDARKQAKTTGLPVRQFPHNPKWGGKLSAPFQLSVVPPLGKDVLWIKKAGDGWIIELLGPVGIECPSRSLSHLPSGYPLLLPDARLARQFAYASHPHAPNDLREFIGWM